MAEVGSIESITKRAARAAAAGDVCGVDAAVDTLATLAAAVGRQAVGAGVGRVCNTTLAQLWEAGWQPSEAARAVRRRCSPRHGALAITAIAAEASAAIPDRGSPPPAWRSQLDTLGADRWWGRGDDWLAPAARRDRIDWLIALQATIEVLAVWLLLPPLEVLFPPPSAWGRQVWIAPSEGGSDDAVLAKIRALLAKAESTSFEAEADALTTKAQELMTRHSIDDLLARGRPDSGRVRPSARRMAVDEPYADAKSSLLRAVGSANGARCVWLPEVALMTVIGFGADLDGIEALFTSLLVQATRALVSARPATDARGRSRTRSYRQSFLIAFAVRIGERLAAGAEAARRHAEAELSVSLLPVLASREEEVDEAVGEMFPRLVRRRAPSVSNYEGWVAGQTAANLARLDGDRAPLGRSNSA